MNKWIKFKDVPITIIMVIFTWCILSPHFLQDAVDVSAIINDAILLLISFAGFFGIASYLGFSAFVPTYIQYAEYKKIEREAKIYMQENNHYFRQHGDEKTRFILEQLGINQKQFDSLNLKLIEMRCLPCANSNDMQEKLECILTQEEPIIIDQKKYNSSELIYNRVRIYINTTDLMFIPQYCEELASLLTHLIIDKVKDCTKFDKLVVPSDSNFLLALEVGKRLRKPVVKMRPQGKIFYSQPWDGDLKNGDCVLLIHDVLVTGSQIIDARNEIIKYRNSCEVKGLFCLIARTDTSFNGIATLNDAGIPAHYISGVSDAQIEKIRGKQDAMPIL